MGFVYFLLIGLAAGWLAGKITTGAGFGWIGNLVIGVLGAFIGGLLFQMIGLAAVGLLGEIIAATVGAIVLLYVLAALKRAGKI